MGDPEAVCKLEYDRLIVNGRSYVWCDGIQAIVDTVDNKVTRFGEIFVYIFSLRLYMIQEQGHVMFLVLLPDRCLGHRAGWGIVTAQCLGLAICQEPTQS